MLIGYEIGIYLEDCASSNTFVKDMGWYGYYLVRGFAKAQNRRYVRDGLNREWCIDSICSSSRTGRVCSESYMEYEGKDSFIAI